MLASAFQRFLDLFDFPYLLPREAFLGALFLQKPWRMRIQNIEHFLRAILILEDDCDCAVLIELVDVVDYLVVEFLFGCLLPNDLNRSKCIRSFSRLLWQTTGFGHTSLAQRNERLQPQQHPQHHSRRVSLRLPIGIGYQLGTEA